MPPKKAATIHRPLLIDEARPPINPAEITVVISERDTEKKPLFYSCLRATTVGFLYATLRQHKHGNKVDGKELRFNGKVLPKGSDVTLGSLVASDDLMVDFYIDPQSVDAKVKSESDDGEEEGQSIDQAPPKRGNYAVASKLASLQLEVSLHRDIIGKPLHVKEAILDEVKNLHSALISLLQRPNIHGNDAEKAQVHTEQLKDILENALTDPTIVGVMGTTGSGKSSLMNALFGNDLFPVSGTRACTAAVTEISHNKTDVPFRAVVKFISVAAWRAELDLLRQDIDTAKDDVEAAE